MSKKSPKRSSLPKKTPYVTAATEVFTMDNPVSATQKSSRKVKSDGNRTNIVPTDLINKTKLTEIVTNINKANLNYLISHEFIGKTSSDGQMIYTERIEHNNEEMWQDDDNSSILVSVLDYGKPKYKLVLWMYINLENGKSKVNGADRIAIGRIARMLEYGSEKIISELYKQYKKYLTPITTSGGSDGGDIKLTLTTTGDIELVIVVEVYLTKPLNIK